MNDRDNSYRQILRASSIMGSAQVLTYLIGLIRVKIVAVILGPSGVGLIGVYASIINLISTASGLGISSSAVREVVRANSEADTERVGRTIGILQRASFVFGLAGALLAIILARPISNQLLESADNTWVFTALGFTVLLGSISAGQLALLQGLRRIGDIARVNILGVLVSTVVAIGLYSCFGQDGIVPVFVTTALISLGFSFWFSNQVTIAVVVPNWTETLIGIRRLAALGFAFMWSGLLMAGVDVLTRAVIAKLIGLDAAGIYQAVWVLSGMFAAFILTAMGTDFYPRLTAVIHDRVLAERVVNEQTEIGILLALPGMLGTLAFAPLIMELFYTKQFVSGSALLPWMILGIFGRVVSWPMGFIQLAKGASRWYFTTETTFAVVQSILLLVLVMQCGIVGAAYAFALTYGLYTICMLWVSGALIGFRWSVDVARLLRIAILLIGVGVSAQIVIHGLLGQILSGFIAAAGCAVSALGLARKLRPNGKWAKWAAQWIYDKK